MATKSELTTASSKLDETESKLDKNISESNAQKIEIATLSEREKQLQAQIKEKENLLKQAEKREATLQATISEFSKKNI